MEILVTYDVSTTTPEGQRRLRRVAKLCEAHGQRVQQSVFECTLSAPQLEVLKHRLWREIDRSQDSLRFYRLREPFQRYVEVLGVRPAIDFHDTVVI